MNLECVGVSKAYVTMGRRHTVFENLNLGFPKGINVGLIGPNGSGKSTLLRLLAGADTPDEGYPGPSDFRALSAPACPESPMPGSWPGSIIGIRTMWPISPKSSPASANS
jgi:energy-coupling factor transporter ATP-binding protein EcfA2